MSLVSSTLLGLNWTLLDRIQGWDDSGKDEGKRTESIFVFQFPTKLNEMNLQKRELETVLSLDPTQVVVNLYVGHMVGNVIIYFQWEHGQRVV